VREMGKGMSGGGSERLGKGLVLCRVLCRVVR
jgi:hypothetical protein